ncbi:molybdopterin-dependent oxidoreductase [Kibdelosporangium philippinense]|uniref:Molybdopterin-dependent oxidoreductase n=1 Tax=Kibdelosporangium philippinense TaxID=211113 RepID=A0ABS8ZHB8_9PSEU|nr:molybdopterin cofactor-binding domain-containing protein [Kibdelosporangium philippinense]MCE7006877.1 molybdopterin-dependent oxidoreductase [Kibdelosporangium philippinense]
MHTQQNMVTLDMLSNTIMRAPGEAIGSFALESAMDELAYKLDMDPVELRMRNQPARNPISGKRIGHRMLREAFARISARSGWIGTPARSGSPGSSARSTSAP